MPTRFTKTHFEFLADIVADLPGIHRDAIAPVLASKLAETNRLFNRRRFLVRSQYRAGQPNPED